MGANTGQAIFNVVGMVLNYYYPGAGLLVSAAGMALFPSGQDVTGPRAQDQGFTTSQVGLDIPDGVGTQKYSGNVIWAGPLVEHKHDMSAKGSSPTATSFTYTRSFSVLIRRAPDGGIKGIRRAWRNGACVYDRRPQMPDESASDFTSRSSENTKFENRTRVYLGTDDQLPCPVQEAALGVGKVPAYRGRAYITFEDEDITDTGARVPGYEFEVVEFGDWLTGGGPEYGNETMGPWLQQIDPRNQFQNDHVYVVTSDIHGNSSPTTYNSLEAALAAAGTTLTLDNLMGWGISISTSDNGILPTSLYPVSNEYKWVQMHFNSVELDTPPVFRRYNLACNILDDVPVNTKMCLSYDTNGPCVAYWLPAASTPSPGSTGIADCGVTNRIWRASEYNIIIGVLRVPKAPTNPCRPPGHIWPLLPEDDRYCVINNSDVVFDGDWTKVDLSTHFRILLDPIVQTAPDNTPANLPVIPSWDERYNDEDFWKAAKRQAEAKGFVFPSSGLSGSVFGTDYAIDKTNQHWKVMQKYTEEVGTSHIIKYPLANGSIPQFDARYSDQAYWEAIYASLSPGLPGPPAGISSGLTYGVDYPVAINSGYIRVPPDQKSLVSLPVALSYAVSAVAAKANIGPEYLDVSQLTEMIIGLRITSNTSARAAITQLQQYGFFDAIEADGQLKFPLRGLAPVATLGDDDLGAHTVGEDVPPLIDLQRGDPSELPRVLNVHFDDVDNDYQAGQQPATWLTDDASGTQDISLSIAMSSTKASQIADIAITELWWARESYKLSIMPKWLSLTAGDVIGIPLEGRIENVRLAEMDMPLPVGPISATVARTSPAIYSSFRERISSGPKTPTPSIIGLTFVTVLDVPALRDSDNDGGFYIAVSPMLSKNRWQGCLVQISTDGQSTWQNVGNVMKSAIVGTAVDALPAPPAGEHDETNELAVTLPATSQLQSVTEDQMYAGANPCALGAPGRWELLQFANHTDNGDGTRTLSDFLRGQRRTDPSWGSHGAGDTFVFLQDGLLRIPLDASFVGKTISLRAISLGLSESSAQIIDIVPTGASLSTIVDGGDIDE